MKLGELWSSLWSRPAASAPEVARVGQERGADRPEEGRKLGTVELSGGVRASEYEHAIETREGRHRMRTIVTEGLSAMGATEVSATVPLEWGDDSVRAVLNLLQQLEQLTKEKRLATLGGWTGFRSSGLGGGRPLGVIYARGTSIPGVSVGASTLAAVLLHEEELRLVQRGLATRVLGRLADRSRYFPYPPWWEIRDTPVLSEREQQQSLLERISPHVHLHDVRVSRVNETTLLVSLSSSAAEGFRKLWTEHPDLKMFALHAHLSPDADGQMIWLPGAQEPHATAVGDTPPRRIGYAFAVFVGSGDKDLYRGIEDGAGVTLSEQTFARLRDVFTAGSEFTLPLDDQMTLQVAVRPVSILDPFTGQAIRAAGDWERYEPFQPAVDAGRVSHVGIVLLTPEHLLAERVDVQVLSEFIRSVEASMERLASEHPVATITRVALQFTLCPGAQPQVKIAYQGEEPQMLSALSEAVCGMAPVQVRGEVAFRIDASLHRDIFSAPGS
jgi:hypothetical protein